MTHRIGNIIDLVAWRAERRNEIDALLALVSRTRSYYALARPRDNVVKLERKQK